MIPFYDFINQRVDPDKINLGLAHGIPSILKFCVQCFKQGICPDKTSQLANEIIAYLLDNMNREIHSSYFPNFIEEGRNADQSSRVAWCYGDLGVGYILYQAGVAFKKTDLTDLALQILRHSAKRKKGGGCGRGVGRATGNFLLPGGNNG